MLSYFRLLSLFLCCGLTGKTLAQIQVKVRSNYLTPSLQGSSWPGQSTWAALNTTLGGRLQALRPWAAVCYTDDPLYDPAECKLVLSNYTNDHTRETIPSALLWANWESCGYSLGCALNNSDPQPVSGEICHQGTTPSYSFPISSSQDVSEIVNWAVTHNVTLTIKNTGHDYLGRSARPFSLQVFTHNLNSIEYISNFVPQGSAATPVPAITFGAGAQAEAIYSVAEANNVSVVLPNCLTVGAAGGYIQGGGHSILSPTYGLAVDNLLEMEIVTADGIVRTINAAQDPDLFWAAGGGGAGNWGIITSITIATLPPTAISSSTLVITPNPAQNLQTLGINFIALFGKYQNQFINSGIASFVLFINGSYDVVLLWPAGKAPVSILYPLFEDIQALSGNYTVVLNMTQASKYPSASAAVLDGIGPTSDANSFFGSSTQISSRFIPQAALESEDSIRSVAEAIWEGAEILNAPVAGVNPDTVTLLYGGMPAATRQRVNETGANPGFYNATWYVWYLASWSELGVSESTYLALTEAVYNAVGPVTALGMTSSYQNEASAWEPNWQQAFFGYKYDRLLAIKQKYDPANFFTTYKAVGSRPNATMYACYQMDQQPNTTQCSNAST